MRRLFLILAVVCLALAAHAQVSISGGVVIGGTNGVTTVAPGGFPPLFSTANPTTTPVFNPLPFGAHLFFGNCTGVSANPAACLIGTEDTTPNWWALDTGAVNVLVATLPTVPDALRDGMIVEVRPGHANTIGNPTLNVNALGNITIVRPGGSALQNGDLSTTAIAFFLYNSVGPRFELQNPQTTNSGSGVVPSVQAYPAWYSSPTTVGGGFNPVASLFFANGDRGAGIHACILANTNGVSGDWCDARGELSTNTTITANMFPTVGDSIGGGGVSLPSGKLAFVVGQSMYANGFRVEGTGVASSSNGTGPTQFFPANSYTVGSGSTFNPFLFNFGLPPWGISSAGGPGPYSSYAGKFSITCSSKPNTAGMSIFSGQDDTYEEDIGIRDCPVANLIGGAKTSSNGIDFEHSFMLHSASTSCIAGTTSSGGVLWTAGNWTVDNHGIVVMNAPTGGSGGNSAGAALVPGVGMIIGQYADNNGSGTSHGTNVPNGGTHATNINGDYRVAAVADMMTVTSYSYNAGTNILTLNGTNDFPQDISSSCTSGSTSTESTDCTENGLIYLSGFGGGDTALNGRQVVIFQQGTSTSTVKGFLSSGSAPPSSGGAGAAAYANSVDQRATGTYNGDLGAAFTTAGQIAFIVNATQADSGSGGSGTITAFTEGIEIYAPANFRRLEGITEVAQSCHAANSEHPLHELRMSGKSLGHVQNSHLEYSYGADVIVGADAATQGGILSHILPVTNAGYIGNNGGATSPSFKSAGVLLSNQFGAVMNLTLLDISCLGGANKPTYCIEDDFNGNKLTSTNNGNTNYWTDGSGAVGGVFTNADPQAGVELANGVSVFDDIVSGWLGGTQKFALNGQTGVINAGTGFQIGAAAAAGSRLEGNGTNFVAVAPTFGTVPDSGPTISWALGSSARVTATLTFTVHGGSRTLNITNPVNGGRYTLYLKQDATGGENLTGGTGCTWKQAGGGGSTFSLTNSASAIDRIEFDYDGTNCYASLTKNFS